MLGELSSDDIERVLHSAALGRIGCHANGRTYVVPVAFAYDGRRIIAHSAPGLKITMMRETQEVCFEVEEVDDLANWRSVIAWGEFRELSGGDAAAAIGLLVDKLRPLVSKAEFHGHSPHSVTPATRIVPAQSTVIFCLELKEKSGRFERQEG